MDNSILSYLRDQYGCEEIDSSFYRNIDEWRRWYDGSEDQFHSIRVNNGIAVVEHKISRMNMAKKVAEDWANMLMNERTRIDVNDPDANVFLQGANGSGGILGENDFRTQMNQLVEKTFALGTGAVLLWLENAQIDDDGSVQASPEGTIRMEYVTAPQIIPLSWRGGMITEAAFTGSMVCGGERLTYLQVHKKEAGTYVIRSVCFSDSTGKEAPLPEGVSPIVRTNSTTPWFFIIRPNLVNNLTETPMGISVYANALDILKGIDLCYDSFDMEFYLGKKMVFLRKDLMMHDENGRMYAPQDCNRQLFMYIGDKNVDGDLLPQEFNPELRVSAHTEAIQQHLNYLSCKCGFGDRYYRFNQTSQPATATEIVSADATLFRSVRKHEILLEQFLIRLIRGILSVGRNVLGKDFSPDLSVSVRFDDSIVEDRPAEQKRDMELVAAGLMLNWEFRMKYYGENEETAKERCKENKETWKTN